MTNEPTLADRIARAEPTSIALQDGERSLSYSRLNHVADRVADRLRTLGITHGDCVTICIDRSFAQICAALGILRAAATYIPVDPTWPEERIRHVLLDSGSRILLAPSHVFERLGTGISGFDPAPMLLEPDLPFQTSPPDPPLASDLAYIIYTSGSTGVPKGVEITHANLANLIDWHLSAFKVTADDCATHLAGLGFDAAIWEIWPYLAVGARVVLADSLTRNDPAMLQQWIVHVGATISFVPTPLAEHLITEPWPANTRLRFLLTGGDTLHGCPAPGLPFLLVNNYGPTECTVVATSGHIPSGTAGLPSIGTAIQGGVVYLLDEHQNAVPDGTVGEIFIGGRGVGRGYRNLPAQTTSSFLPDPFSSAPGARMFKTGDLALRRADGTLSFMGRRDNQVKIRGYRIELDEIIHVLNRHPAVASSVVNVQQNAAGEQSLVAYIVRATEHPLTSRELQQFAAQFLPDYMVPATFVSIRSIPLTANGKIDLNALPAPVPANMLDQASTREPGTDIEEILLAIVRTLLHSNAVGVEDDFFLAGGHSLLGTQVVLRARETFGVLLTLRDLFEAPTVALLATRIEELVVEQLESMSEEEALVLVLAHAEQTSDRERSK